LALVKIEGRIVRSQWNEAVRLEEEEEKRKKREAILRKKEEEEKHIAKEAREAERARKRERARVAEAKDKKRDKKGKWPRVIDTNINMLTLF
jgi:rubrerythrin